MNETRFFANKTQNHVWTRETEPATSPVGRYSEARGWPTELAGLASQGALKVLPAHPHVVPSAAIDRIRVGKISGRSMTDDIRL